MGMWGNLYLFGASFLAHWWPLVSAGSLLGFEEFAERYWRWASELLKRIPDARRRNFKVLAILAAAIYSGYLAWSDEHTARLEAEKTASEATQKLQELPPDQKATIERLSLDLTAARGKIDQQQTTIDNQQKELTAQEDKIREISTPKPIRRLTEEQKTALRAAFEPVASKFSTLQISAPMEDGEAQGYARDFMDFFNSINIKVSNVSGVSPTNAHNLGPFVEIGVKDLSWAPPNAELFAETMVKGGIQVRGAVLNTLSDDGFALIIDHRD